MKLVIGLGNIGNEYKNTRHNAGFLAVDAVAASMNASWKNDNALHAELCKGTINGTSVILAKPTTFMNRSGDAAQAIASYYKIGIGDILIVQDEMDIAPGALAFKFGGGAAGHNGITSIQERLATNDFARLRIGIGRPEGQTPKEQWVLGKIDPATMETTSRAAQAIEDWFTNGLAKAMNTWNQKESS